MVIVTFFKKNVPAIESTGIIDPIYMYMIQYISYRCVCSNKYHWPVARRRITKIGATYFVSSELNRGETAFAHNDLQTILYQVIDEAHTQYNFELWDMHIKDNSFECCIKPAFGQSLSRILQWIKSVVARRWNKLHGMHGHLWGARFYSEILEEEKLVEAVVREVVEEATPGFTQSKADLVSYHSRKVAFVFSARLK
jgi:REP element-mobilizing transposase RayT